MRTFKISSIIILIGALIASLFSSCGSNTGSNKNNVSVYHQTENFNKIVLQGGYQVSMIQTNEPHVKVSTNTEMHKNTEVYVENETLYIKMSGKNITAENAVSLDININKLDKLVIEGGAVLNTVGYLSLDEFVMELKGGAHVKMQIKANTIHAKGEGGVSMQFEGVCNVLTASTEGAGNINAIRLKANVVNCRVAGVGNASVYATDTLNATVEGVGRISYRGKPVVNRQINGLGVVHRK